MLKSTQDLILSFLPGTSRSVAEGSGRELDVVYVDLAKMKRLGVVHISGYDLSIRAAAVYSAGAGIDAVKPKSGWAKYRMPPPPPMTGRAKGIPIVTQAMRTPSSIWAYAQQQGAANGNTRIMRPHA